MIHLSWVMEGMDKTTCNPTLRDFKKVRQDHWCQEKQTSYFECQMITLRAGLPEQL